QSFEPNSVAYPANGRREPAGGSQHQPAHAGRSPGTRGRAVESRSSQEVIMKSSLALGLFTVSCIGLAGTTPAPPSANPQAAEKEKAPDDAWEKERAQRLSKLRQLQLDRRPSTILKAWADLKESTGPTRPKGKDQKPDPFERKLKELQKDVTLGN